MRGPRPAAAPARPGAAAGGAKDCVEIVTAPSNGCPTPDFAGPPRPPPPPPRPGLTIGKADVTGRVSAAVMPPGQVAEPAGAVAGKRFCHSILPRSVSIVKTFSLLPPMKA